MPSDFVGTVIIGWKGASDRGTAKYDGEWKVSPGWVGFTHFAFHGEVPPWGVNP